MPKRYLDSEGKYAWDFSDDVVETPEAPKLVKPTEEQPKLEDDLNGDGIVDKKDKSFAGRFLAKGKKKK